MVCGTAVATCGFSSKDSLSTDRNIEEYLLEFPNSKVNLSKTKRCRLYTVDVSAKKGTLIFLHFEFCCSEKDNYTHKTHSKLCAN